MYLRVLAFRGRLGMLRGRLGMYRGRFGNVIRKTNGKISLFGGTLQGGRRRGERFPGPGPCPEPGPARGLLESIFKIGFLGWCTWHVRGVPVPYLADAKFW